MTTPASDMVASELHGSLMLDEILRGCFRVLSGLLKPERISLVQYRGSTSAVTLYSLNPEVEPPQVKPRVIPLVPSRLNQCLNSRERLIAELSGFSEQDAMEQNLIFRPETTSAIYLPLVLKDKLKGVLVLELPGNLQPHADQLAFLDDLARHLSLALDNSDTHYLERRRGRQLAMVSEIARQAVLFENLGDFLPSAAELLRQGFNYDSVQIWVTTAGQDSLRLRGFAHSAPINRIVGASIPKAVEECRRGGQSICSNNLLEEAGEDPGRQIIASRLAVPIRLRGKLMGVLLLESCRLDAFPAEDLAITEGVASLIASAFDHIHILESAQQSCDYMQAVLDASHDLAILSTDINGYVIMSGTGVKPVFRVSQDEILGRDILTLFTDEHFRTDLAVYLDNPAVRTLDRQKLPHSIGDADSYLDVTVHRVQDCEKRPIGFLCMVRDVTETVLLHQMLEAMSITDELTGLCNQRRFFSALPVELERSRRYNRDLSICFIDLDGFKKYNDTHGHLRGDQALKEAAVLIGSMVRSGVDTCYRYGGDEFVIVMPETDKRNAQNVAERLRARLSDHFAGEITTSIGIAQADGPATLETLVDEADKAMYKSKAKGGNCITLSAD